ncbi:MAG: Tetratricopeptide 2 repeat protein [Candidatus Solibacter sp.]|nr:Tetratricopeptide 2 repeat protein [Candidatus Solibacter sp.]
MSRAAIAVLLILPHLFAQTVAPWNDRTYRQDFDQLISDGQYAEGEAAARKAIRKAEQETGPQSIQTALALDMLTEANFYGDRVRDPAAEETALRAIAIKEKLLGPDHTEVAVSYRLMGYVMGARGDYERSRRAYESAVRIHRKTAGQDPRQEAAALGAYAAMLSKTGDFTEAKAAYEEMLAIRLKNFPVETYNTADAMIGYATLLRDIGAYEQSRTYFLRGLAILEKKAGVDHIINTRGLNELGALLNLMGKASEAVPLLERTLAIEEKTYGPEQSDLAFVLNNLAIARAALGDLAAARKLYERAIAIAVNVYGEDHPEVARFLSGYAHVLLRLGEKRLAFDAAVRTEKIGRAHVALTIRSLPERQALLYATTRPSGLDVALSIAASDPALRRRALDEVIRSRALVFDEMAARRRTVGHGPLWDALSEARQKLSRLVVQGPESFKGKDYAEALRRARLDNEAAERALAEQSAAFQSLRARGAAGLDEVARVLSPGDALVSFVRYGATPAYAAFVQRPGQETQLIRLGAATKIEALIDAVRKQVLAEAENPGVSPKRAETLYRAAGDALRRQVWDPLEPALGRSRRVFLTPVVALNLVDFGALPARGEGYLAEHGPLLHYLSTERDAVLEPAAKGGSGLLAFGNPSVNAPARRMDAAKALRGDSTPCLNFGAMRFAPLPASELEVRDVATLWREAGQGAVMERTGNAANEASFKSNSAGKKVVHVAAHAFYLGNGCSSAVADNPLLLSGLALARGVAGEDGIVTAEEIAAMDLSGVEWAVLSGCETGVGKLMPGEGVFGLRRAFQMAGSRTVIMSLWPVDDQATRTWMKTLYREHLAKGKGTAESVRAASLASLAKRRAEGMSTHPFYWAGFIAAGDWR